MTTKNALEPQDPRTTTDAGDMTERCGPPPGLTCPDCDGALWETAEQGLVRRWCPKAKPSASSQSRRA